MKKNFLITGAKGQDGLILSDVLIKKGYKVFGLIKKKKYSNFVEKVKYLQSNLSNKKQVLKNKFEKKNNTFKLPPNLTKLSTVTKIIKHSDLSKIQNGMKVLHSKFGNGKILEISGDEANKKATIFFENVGQKQLLLKFAKLEII